MTAISKDTYKFLKDLKKNNNREWFNTNKSRYTEAHENVIAFADTLLSELSKKDNIETVSGKKSLFRIYRDVRFSKDKSPYKTWWAGGFKRATASLRGGYYFHIEPGQIFAAGGFWGPNKDDLLLIRQQIQADPDPLRKIINSKKFKDHFGSLEGEQLKTAPKGFDKEDPAVDLLKYKQFLVTKKIDSKLEDSEKLVSEIAGTFQAMRPFFDYMSEILTTDLNGESTI
ncbi:MAG: TIGR02453 family protein [Crocinitomicaceae bacterium]|nr:TIGR02453 family protein [Crocinitomicaceae bacterium]|tara:strand:+ start:210 stop:893 length:684 start_codon:yes stop_codon:yes gene_type:complete